MIKKYLIVVIATIFLFGIVLFNGNYKNIKDDEFRGIFVSYIEYMKYFDNKTDNEIEKEIKNMIINIDKLNFNQIFLQVRPFSDSIYESSVFPYSHTISGIQGEKGIDVLECFIKEAHRKNMKIHAWINPYRISNYTDTSFLSEDNMAYKWLNTNKVEIIVGKGIFYNPASSEVIDLIISGVEEIVENYDVDSIMFDDYFYPQSDIIDELEYNEVKDTISIKDFRLSKVNELIEKTYKKVKEIDSDVLFGISPDANIDNNYEMHYADIKKWLKEDGYIDYIMPQLYYGFSHETKPFIKTLNEWNDLIENDVILIPTLNIYKSGNIDNYAGTGKNEWIENSNILKKQIQVSRNLNCYIGFSVFRYDYFIDIKENVNLQQEVDNYLSLF